MEFHFKSHAEALDRRDKFGHSQELYSVTDSEQGRPRESLCVGPVLHSQPLTAWKRKAGILD